MFSFNDKIKYTPDSSICEEGFLVQVNNPVIVREHVDVLLQAVLKGSRLEERSAFSAVTGGNHKLQQRQCSDKLIHILNICVINTRIWKWSCNAEWMKISRFRNTELN